jgi:hypothetical protein
MNIMGIGPLMAAIRAQLTPYQRPTLYASWPGVSTRPRPETERVKPAENSGTPQARSKLCEEAEGSCLGPPGFLL